MLVIHSSRVLCLIPLAMFGVRMASVDAADLDIRDEVEFRKCLAVDADLEQIATGLGFTEGCQWMPTEGGWLLFSDVRNSRLHRWTRHDGLSIFRDPSRSVNGNTLDNDGRLISCEQGERRVVRMEKDGTLMTLVDRFEGKRFNSPNDVAVHPKDGSIWFTDPDYGFRQNPGSADGRKKELDGNFLYRIDGKTGKLAVARKDFSHPNGLCFSPDGQHLYVNDSGPTTLHTRAFDVQPDGQLLGGRVIATTTASPPDGLRCDRDGRIWSTGDGGVRIMYPDGSLIGIIKVPEQPTNCCFGGDAMKTLFVTARASVYAIPVRVKGIR